jgi:hypothetical protein
MLWFTAAAMTPSSQPSAALRLGYLATLPFLTGAVLVWIVDPASRAIVAQALSAYAAVVVAFIGAIHWGIAFSQPRPATGSFVWGIVPSLVAWIAVLSPPSIGLVVHAVTLVVCYLVDRATYPMAGVAAWLPLRLRLTIVATLCCLAGAAGA